MADVLLIDGCVRGWEVSNTYCVAEKFMEAYRKANPNDIIEEIHLSEESIACTTAKDVERRNKLIDEGNLDAPEFAMSHRFAKADKIILAVPFWNLIFPSAVIAYFEHASVRNITFTATEHGMQGKCTAEKLICIMTSGGIFSEIGDERAVVSYLRAFTNMLGINETTHLWIEGLDIDDGQADERLQNGIEKAIELASTW